MSKYCVVVAELARARIFTLEPPEVPGFDSGPNLVERKSFANTERKASDSDLWEDTRRGAHRENISGQRGKQVQGIPHHNYDEHREENERQHTRFFAKQLVEELDRMVQDQGLQQIILCAETQMMGFLRPEIGGNLNQVQLKEVQKDLTNFSPRELHKKLASEGYLPAREVGPDFGGPTSRH